MRGAPIKSAVEGGPGVRGAAERRTSGSAIVTFNRRTNVARAVHRTRRTAIDRALAQEPQLALRDAPLRRRRAGDRAAPRRAASAPARSSSCPTAPTSAARSRSSRSIAEREGRARPRLHGRAALEDLPSEPLAAARDRDRRLVLERRARRQISRRSTTSSGSSSPTSTSSPTTRSLKPGHAGQGLGVGRRSRQHEGGLRRPGARTSPTPSTTARRRRDLAVRLHDAPHRAPRPGAARAGDRRPAAAAQQHRPRARLGLRLDAAAEAGADALVSRVFTAPSVARADTLVARFKDALQFADVPIPAGPGRRRHARR